MNIKILVFISMVFPGIVLAGMRVTTIQDSRGVLVFDYNITDSLEIDQKNKPILPGSLSDIKSEPFYPASFALPQGSSIASITVIKSKGPVRCIFASSGMVRQTYIAAFRVYPVSYSNGKPMLSSEARISINYSSPLAKATLSLKADNQFAENALKGMIGNYATSLTYRAPVVKSLAKVASNPSSESKIKMFTRKEGIYAITYDQIQSFGFQPGSVDPIYFHLYSSEREIPIYIETSIKGRFSPGDRILFYATFEQGKNGKYYSEYTLGKAYYLDWNNIPGSRAPLVSGAPKYMDSLGVHPYDPTKFSTEDRNIRPIENYRNIVHLEEDDIVVRLSTPENTFSSDVSPQDFEQVLDDYWMWKEMPGSVEQSLINFHLDAAPALAGTAYIKIRLLGYSQGVHKISEVFLNGVKLKPAPGPGVDLSNGSLTFNGQKAMTFETENSAINLPFLKGGNNLLSINHGIGDSYYLNWIEVGYDAVPGLADSLSQKITLDTGNIRGTASYFISISGVAKYPEIWDISGRRFNNFSFINKTVRLYDIINSPVSYFVTQNILSPEDFIAKPSTGIKASGQGAHLLIITPSAMRSQADSYAQYKKTQGITAFVANVESIYDEFGDGSIDPDAIRAFVKYAYESFDPKPYYLLLLGNGSEGSDKKSPLRNLIPTYFVQMNGWGITSADTRFTTVSGDDLFPDLSVGRIPGKNATEIDAALKKIMAYEGSSDQGLWKDNFLLIGGFEGIFTAANNRFQTNILRNRFNVRRVDADTASQYFFAQSNPSEVRNSFSSGSLFVNFYGHGGGSVWSDGRPSIMDNPSAASLVNLARLPIVFSMTCLTASFETVFDEFSSKWTPLGETMMLSPQGGSAAFYGASGHSFVTPDYLLSTLVMQEAAQPDRVTAGDIIFNAEQSMISSFGTQYFPVICQYNLLGDPSMKVNRPIPMLVNALNPSLAAGDTLLLSIRSDSITNGSGVVRIYKNDGGLSFYRTFTFNGPTDTVKVTFKAGQTFSSGQARVLVWDNSKTASGDAMFALTDISLTDAMPYAISGADTEHVEKCALGDSIYIEGGVFLPGNMLVDTAYASWEADTSYLYLSGRDTLGNIVMMKRINPVDTIQPFRFSTETGIDISNDIFGLKRGLSYSITVIYRTQDNTRRVYRKFYYLPIKAPPDLCFPGANKISLAINGKLIARARFLNYGETTSKPFSISRILNDTQIISVPYLSILPSRSMDSIEAPLEVNGFIKIRMTLDNDNAIIESDEGNNSATAYFGMNGTTLNRIDSVLTAPFKGITVRTKRITDTLSLYMTVDNIDSMSLNRPVFLKENPCPLSPLQAYCRPRDADSLPRYDFTIMTEAAFAGYDSLLTVSYKYSPEKLSKQRTLNSVRPIYGFYSWDTLLNLWRWKDAVIDTMDSSVTLITGPGKRLIPGIKLDAAGPVTIASVNGRVLSYKDFIPLRTPIDIYIQDESAVDTATIKIFLSGGELLPRDRYSMCYAGTTHDVNISFRPSKQGQDSLYVLSSDINGNASDTARFGYQLGSDLSIKSFANHPNPFGTQTRFAFTITDDADVEMLIYTLSGRMIKSITLKNVIGYNEVLWDAKDDRGRKISNGTYYLKLTVKNRDRSIEQIHKISKAEGR